MGTWERVSTLLEILAHLSSDSIRRLLSHTLVSTLLEILVYRLEYLPEVVVGVSTLLEILGLVWLVVVGF